MPNTSVNADLNVNVNANVDDARVKIEGLEKLIAGDAWKVRLVADDSGILKQLQKISTQIEKIGNKPIEIKYDIKQADTAFNAIQSNAKSTANNVSKAFRGISLSPTITGDFDTVSKRLTESVARLKREGKDISIDLFKDADGNGFVVSLQEGTKAAQKFHYAIQELNGTKISFMDQNMSSVAKADLNDINKLIQKYESLQKKIASSNIDEEVKPNLNAQINSQISALKAERDQVYTTTAAWQSYKSTYSSVESEFKTSNAATNTLKNQDKSVKEITASYKKLLSLQNQMTNFFERNRKARGFSNGSDLQRQVAGLLSAYNSTKTLSEDQIRQVGELSGKWTQFKTQAVEAGKASSGVFSALSNKAKQFGTYLATSLGFQYFITGVKSMVKSVAELDNAMVELKKTTNGSAQDYSNFLKDATKIGNEVGRTTSEITQAAAEWSRSGYNLSESADLAKASTMYTNISEYEDVSEATTSLISIMKAFGLESSNVYSVLDKLNEVGNTTATTSQGLGDALQRSGSALATAGNSLDESLGLIVAGNNALQNPEKVGRVLPTLKTAISVKLRGRTRPRKDYKYFVNTQIRECVFCFVHKRRKLWVKNQGFI